MRLFTKALLLIMIVCATSFTISAQTKDKRHVDNTTSKSQVETLRADNNSTIFTKTMLLANDKDFATSTIDRDAWITWSGEPQEAVGAGNNSDWVVAQRFEPSDLAAYNGQYLSKIKFVPSAATCTYEVKIFVGGNASNGYHSGTLVRNRMLATNDLNIGQWNEIDILPALPINASQELWIAYRCISQTGNPAGCDLGPKVPGKGNLIYFDGAWAQISELDPNFDINWCIQGFIEPTAPSILYPDMVTNFNVTAGANQALSATLTWNNPTLAADGTPLTGLDSVIIKRNGEYWASVTNTNIGANVTWADNRIYESGYYIYTVIPVNQYGSGLFVEDTVAVGRFCETSVYMTDTWGDGWQGNSIQFKTMKGEVVGNAFLDEGATGTMVLSMPNVVLDCSWTIGAFPDDVGFVITSPTGEVVYNCPSGGAVGLGGVFANYLNSCTEEVPQAPTNFTAQGNGMDVALSWTNPSTTLSGTSLTSLSNLIIKRDGNIVQVIENPTVGANASWTDETIAVGGEYEYTIMATNQEGCGPSVATQIVLGDVCNITINMYDTFGDGWYGNSAINIMSEGNIIGMAKLYSGSFAVDTIIVPMGTLDFVWVAGNNDSECGFIIFDHNEIPLYISSGTPVAGSFFEYENTCADAVFSTVTGVVTNAETNNPIENAFVRFAGPQGSSTTTNAAGEYSLEAIVGQEYEVFASADDFTSQTLTFTVAEASNTLDIALFANECPPSADLEIEQINGQEIQLSWSNSAIITLEAHNVWPDGSGYQMLLDPTANTYGIVFPEVGPLTASGDAPQSVYDAFEYKIPENADGSTTTTNTVVDGQISITVPAGTYDFCITNPTANDRIWIASDECDPGRQNDFVFESGKHYHFVVTESETSDCVILNIFNSGRVVRTFNIYRNDEQIASEVNGFTYVDEFDFEEGQTYCYKVETICNNDVTSVLSDESCFEMLGIDELESVGRIYPNPVNQYCIIEGENIQQISVFSATGLLIENMNVRGNSHKINTDSYCNGIYMIRITALDGRTSTKRFVVMH